MDVRVFDRRLRQKQISVVATAESPAEIAAIPRAERTVGQSLKLRWAFLETAASPMDGKAWKELRALDLKREALIASFPTVMVMGERAEPRVTHVLDRGVYDAPGDPVQPGIPAALGSLPDAAPANRLALAQWLISPRQPADRARRCQPVLADAVRDRHRLHRGGLRLAGRVAVAPGAARLARRRAR